MSLLTEQERKQLEDDLEQQIGNHAFDAVERVILAKLAGAELPEPESFEAWNAKQHGDPEEIGFLQALRIAYCSGQDSVNVRQAYAQGAAAQLSDEPFTHYRHYDEQVQPFADENTVPLYTRREAK